jgi:hypothetical protein
LTARAGHRLRMFVNTESKKISETLKEKKLLGRPTRILDDYIIMGLKEIG